MNFCKKLFIFGAILSSLSFCERLINSPVSATTKSAQTVHKEAHIINSKSFNVHFNLLDDAPRTDITFEVAGVKSTDDKLRSKIFNDVKD